jgi:putative transposase
MRQSKFTETQIVSILKKADAGRPVNEIWRSDGLSSATYDKWKAKYGGLEASDIKRLKDLEQENSTLKRLYADMALENAALKDVIAKNSNACCTAGSRHPSGDSTQPSGSAGVSGRRPQSSHVLSIRR